MGVQLFPTVKPKETGNGLVKERVDKDKLVHWDSDVVDIEHGKDVQAKVEVDKHKLVHWDSDAVDIEHGKDVQAMEEVDRVKQLDLDRPLAAVGGALSPPTPVTGPFLVLACQFPSWLLMIGSYLCKSSTYFLLVEDELPWIHHLLAKTSQVHIITLSWKVVELSQLPLKDMNVHLLGQGPSRFLAKSCARLLASEVSITSGVLICGGRAN